MRKALIALLAVGGAATIFVASAAFADHDEGGGGNTAQLNGYQEVSSVSTTGFGDFRVRINRREESADYVLSYRDVETPVQQAHIHLGQRSVNGPVSVFLCANGTFRAGQRADLPMCPPSSGTVRGTFRRSDIIAQNPDRGIEPAAWEELVAALRVGHMYANVHTTRFGGGEIRGQINDRDQREFTGPPPFGSAGDGGDD